jgi:flagellin-specific chaperone FliS
MDYYIHHYLHFDDDIYRLLKQILKKENQIMATLQDVLVEVHNESDLEDSLIVLMGGIVQQLKDAQAQNDPAAIQAVIDQISANKKKLADAVTANTPVNPNPTPAPSVTA